MIRCTRFLPLFFLSALPLAAEPGTFHNPVNPSADPWVGYADHEYRLATTQGNCVRLWSSPTLGGLAEAKPVTIWEKGKGVWAPEFHHLKGPHGMRWYCYFTKTESTDVMHRMFVVESKTDKIDGQYGDPVQLQTDAKDEFYAIDGTVFENKSVLYFAWAGHPGHRLYLSKMADPTKLTGERVMIPASGFGCEEVREGPFVLAHGGKLFLSYSACDTGKPDYKVGYVWAKDTANLMKDSSWTQNDEPLLQRNDAAGVFGPGHHSFFKSADGKEDWIAYHAKTTSVYTYEGRTTRVQPLEWDAEGFPKPVIPLPLTAEIKEPKR